MEPEISLPYSQAPATCPYPELFLCLVRDASSRNTLPTPPPEIRVGEYFTSGLFCLQRKHLACDYFLKFVFYEKELLAPRPTPKLEGNPLSAARDCLFNLFAATLRIRGRSSIRNLRKRHAVVTGTHQHGLVRTHITIHTHACIQIYKQPRRQGTVKFLTAVLTGIIRN